MGRAALPTSSITDRGLTLLELLVTLAILSLAAGLAVPRLTDRAGLSLDAAAAELRDALGGARERAILGGARWRLVVDLDARRWAIGQPRPDGGLEAPAGPLGRRVTLPPAVRVLGVRGAGGDVRSGTAVLDLAPGGDAFPLRIELGDDRGRLAVVVLPPAAARAVVQ